MDTDLPLLERLEIETHSPCNRRCWFCPRTHDRSGKYFDGHGKPVSREMPFGTIKDLLDQAMELGFRGPVFFFFCSEPMLDSRILELASEATARNMIPCLNTNGDLLAADEELCKGVGRAFDRTVIGLYDYTSEPQLEEAKGFWRERMPDADLHFSPIGEAEPVPAAASRYPARWSPRIGEWPFQT